MKKSKVFWGMKAFHKKLLYMISMTVIALSPSVSAYAAPIYNSYPTTSTYEARKDLVSAGGSLWYLEKASGSTSDYYIGNVTTSGVVTDYPIAYPTGVTTGVNIISMVAGPDGNLWFNARVRAPGTSSSTYTGFLNISNGVVTWYSSIVPSYGSPSRLVSDVNGAVWYSVKSAYATTYTYLVRVDVATGTHTTGLELDSYANISSVAGGPDGKVWYADAAFTKRINWITKVGSTITDAGNFVVPTEYYPTGNVISNMVADSNGDIWYLNADKFIKATPAGVFTEYTPSTGVVPSNLSLGPDGMIWFADNSTPSQKKIGRITSSGVISEYSLPVSAGSVGVGSVTTGPDGAVWFLYSDSGVGKIGRMHAIESYLTTSTYSIRSNIVSAGGSLWYLEKASGSTSDYYIGNLSMSGVVTDHIIPYPTGVTTGINIISMVAGPDGNLWFNGRVRSPGSSSNTYTGRFDVSTGAVTWFTSIVPSYSSPGKLVSDTNGGLWYNVKSAYASSATYLVRVDATTGAHTTGLLLDSYAKIVGMAAGPGGKVWYSDDYFTKRLNWLSKVGTTITAAASINVPAAYTTTGALVTNMVADSSSNVWYLNGSKFVKVTPSGIFTDYTPAVGITPLNLAQGANGSIWFTNYNSSTATGKISKITNSGLIVSYDLPASSGSINAGSSTVGPDGATWFLYSDSGVGKIGRLGY